MATMQVIENDVMVEERVFNFNGPDDDSDDFDGDEDDFSSDSSEPACADAELLSVQ